MKKIIRLSESQLTNIIKMVISENNSMTEKKYKTYSKLLNKLTENFDWVSKIDVKLSSTADAGGWRGEESKPLLIVSVYFKNYQKIRMMTQFELFDEISFIHDMFFPHLTGDPLIYSDNVTAYFSVKSVFPNGKTDSFPIQIVSGDYDDVSQISESQLTNIVKRVISENNSMTEKNKKFLIDYLGEDLINSLQKITSPKQLPIEFLKSIGTSIIQRYIDEYGPLYYFVLDGEPFIYKDRESPKGEKYEMYCNNKGKTFLDGEITDRLGLSDMGLRFSDIIDMFINEKEDNSPLNEDVDKNKKFLNNVMGVDFTGNIEQVTSLYDIPYNFYRKGIFTMPDVASYLNRFGPMYIIELYGRKFIYQDRGRYESFISEDGMVYQDTVPEQLGIDVMGLRFSDIIDIYFNEEDSI
jgi:hypothetical protein